MGIVENKMDQILYYQKAYQLAKLWNDTLNLVYSKINIAFVFLQENKLDSALLYVDRMFANPMPHKNYYFYVFI